MERIIFTFVTLFTSLSFLCDECLVGERLTRNVQEVVGLQSSVMVCIKWDRLGVLASRIEHVLKSLRNGTRGVAKGRKS